ncbi:MAG: hypothetical protein EAX95_13540 [Candidatus Thorarchaeota archaeon]|nr:hypothetical protein [Candidatus Thorarchaeota archaeon]
MPKEERKVGPVYRVLSQDLYITDLHEEEMGVRQAEVWRSKSRQFTKDSEIIGKIGERVMERDSDKLSKQEKTGFIALRKSLWIGEMNEGSRRLVVKLFSDKGRWLATLEEMVAESMALSYGINEPVLSFAVIVDGIEIVTYIRQVRRTGLSTETYAFYILGPQGSFEVFRIEGKRATLGDDFKIVRLRRNETVAEVDSKFADIGGEFVVRIKDPVLAENEWFCRVLQCFSVAIRFRNESRKKVEMLMKKWEKGDLDPLQHRYETSLLANPRKLTLSIEELEDI